MKIILAASVVLNLILLLPTGQNAKAEEAKPELTIEYHVDWSSVDRPEFTKPIKTEDIQDLMDADDSDYWRYMQCMAGESA